MGNDGSTEIFENLSTACMVPVVVTVEEILDGLISDIADCLNHLSGVLRADGLNDHDPLASQDEHGDISTGRGEAIS